MRSVFNTKVLKRFMSDEELMVLNTKYDAALIREARKPRPLTRAERECISSFIEKRVTKTQACAMLALSSAQFDARVVKWLQG